MYDAEKRRRVGGVDCAADPDIECCLDDESEYWSLTDILDCLTLGSILQHAATAIAMLLFVMFALSLIQIAMQVESPYSHFTPRGPQRVDGVFTPQSDVVYVVVKRVSEPNAGKFIVPARMQSARFETQHAITEAADDPFQEAAVEYFNIRQAGDAANRRTRDIYSALTQDELDDDEWDEELINNDQLYDVDITAKLLHGDDAPLDHLALTQHYMQLFVGYVLDNLSNTFALLQIPDSSTLDVKNDEEPSVFDPLFDDIIFQ